MKKQVIHMKKEKLQQIGVQKMDAHEMNTQNRGFVITGTAIACVIVSGFMIYGVMDEQIRQNKK